MLSDTNWFQILVGSHLVNAYEIKFRNSLTKLLVKEILYSKFIALLFIAFLFYLISSISLYIYLCSICFLPLLTV